MTDNRHHTAHYRRPASVRFGPKDDVDFVIVGAGGAGGVAARELAVAGFRVVVLEQGPYLHEADFKHDEVAKDDLKVLVNDYDKQPNSFRKTPDTKAELKRAIIYGRMVGGGTAHFTGNYWRFREVDFAERSKWGAVAGTGFADWPISYADLEPYYTRAEWELGVSGQAGVSPGESFRSKPYPLPPLPIKSSGVLLERAAAKLGWHAYPAPMAILSQPYRDRAGCLHCGFCEGFGCEARAKSSSLATVIPEAEATGRCEIRTGCYVRKIAIDRTGRATGVVYFDKDKREAVQNAKAVVLCANGAETPKLLLMSKSNRFPQGLANSSGLVGKYLMFNGWSLSGGLYEHPLNEYKSVVVSRVLHDFYEIEQRHGFYGGGGIDARFDFQPIGFAFDGLPNDAPQWGSDFKAALKQYYTRTMYVTSHSTSLPVEANSISLDPTIKDRWGLPAIRVTYRDHPDDLKTMKFLQQRCLELLNASGAQKVWADEVKEQDFGFHLLGTCRMGSDPKASVIDPDHRTHDVRNLFLCDGSSFVTSGRGQPTETIQALAFRAGDRIAQLAKRREI